MFICNKCKKVFPDLDGNPIVCVDYDALYGDDFAEPDDDSDGDANIFS